MPTYQFGPFALDAAARRLTRAGETIPLADRHVEVLLQRVSRAPAIVAKGDLIDAAWGGLAVTDNSLEQAISTLRRTLDAAHGGGACIDTVARQGYRFSAAVTCRVTRATDAELDAVLSPYRALLDGRAALESMTLERTTGARRAFEAALAVAPEYAPAHVGLANALAFQFEATRADEAPDTTAMAAAIAHAREACRLQPGSAEPWATLGFVLQRRDPMQATAALRRAVELEPGTWRHHLRLAYVGWGEERLAAAHRALSMVPGLALAHWLAATVHIARQSFELAERELAAGAAAQDAQAAGGRFSGIGLHWLRGLLQLHRGDTVAARQEFACELAAEPIAHLYSRETAATTWYALGAMAMHQRRSADATRAFAEALARVPGHACALAALSTLTGDPAIAAASSARIRKLRTAGATGDAALASSVALAAGGDHVSAAEVMNDAFRTAPAGSAGWIVPIEPVLNAHANAAAWQAVLALLRQRAA
jgi:DNA-binding winged helix-turn-helix (wHTH) protein